MNNLLALTINAHGGLTRWNELKTLSAHLVQGGIIWGLKGHAGMVDEVNVAIDLHQPWTSHFPFGAPNYRTSVTPDRAVIETTGGEVVEELANPRASFAGYGLETPWSNLQLSYFVGYAMWNYLTAPFSFGRPGFEVKELEPWEEAGQTLRRLLVTFPADVATHNPVQTFYIATSGLLWRHDYNVDINGGTPAVHYFSNHVTVAGITLPTKHLIYLRNEDLSHSPEPLVVSIELSDIKFS
ncbi:hypothetical protein [Hymenobacter negativus]|uniref:Uncharacterized protein n=1 Tax=Hymenobacter negativus TaxID=2795026 RepID=A0ABS3QK18_9BACT|nr:hypothetical protein [Hymenobacter negativus]MBO2011582.1 hypothetical protein [Hymenobacter negativus]